MENVQPTEDNTAEVIITRRGAETYFKGKACKDTAQNKKRDVQSIKTDAEAHVKFLQNKKILFVTDEEAGCECVKKSLYIEQVLQPIIDHPEKYL